MLKCDNTADLMMVRKVQPFHSATHAEDWLKRMEKAPRTATCSFGVRALVHACVYGLFSQTRKHRRRRGRGKCVPSPTDRNQPPPAPLTSSTPNLCGLLECFCIAYATTVHHAHRMHSQTTAHCATLE